MYGVVDYYDVQLEKNRLVKYKLSRDSRKVCPYVVKNIVPSSLLIPSIRLQHINSSLQCTIRYIDYVQISLQKGGFGLLYHASQIGQYKVCVKFSFCFQCCVECSLRLRLLRHPLDAKDNTSYSYSATTQTPPDLFALLIKILGKELVLLRNQIFELA